MESYVCVLIVLQPKCTKKRCRRSFLPAASVTNTAPKNKITGFCCCTFNVQTIKM